MERTDEINNLIAITKSDSVINTGKTLLEILDPDMKEACCVINEQTVPVFDDFLYAVRVSKNSFVGRNVKKQEGKVAKRSEQLRKLKFKIWLRNVNICITIRYVGVITPISGRRRKNNARNIFMMIVLNTEL